MSLCHAMVPTFPLCTVAPLASVCISSDPWPIIIFGWVLVIEALTTTTAYNGKEQHREWFCRSQPPVVFLSFSCGPGKSRRDVSRPMSESIANLMSESYASCKTQPSQVSSEHWGVCCVYMCIPPFMYWICWQYSMILMIIINRELYRYYWYYVFKCI